MSTINLQSLKEESLKKYKSSCNLIIFLNILALFFGYGIYGNNILIIGLPNIFIIVLALIIKESKSKIATISIIVILFLLLISNMYAAINGGSISFGFLGFIEILVAFSLYNHITIIKKDYDKFSSKIDLHEIPFDNIKNYLSRTYSLKGYEITIDRDNLFKMKKAEDIYLQLSKNHDKAVLTIVDTEKPSINM